MSPSEPVEGQPAAELPADPMVGAPQAVPTDHVSSGLPELQPASPSGQAPPADPRPPIPPVLKVVLASVFSLAGAALFFSLFAYGFSALQEQRSQHVLYSQLRGALSPSNEQAPPVGGDVAAGTAVALMNAPAAGIHNLVVVQGTSSGDLLNGPGHLRDSPLPGQDGQSILLGRSTFAGAPFGGINRLVKGDTLTVQTGQGTFHYTVLDQRTAGALAPQMPASGSLLTLVTSHGSGLVGALAPGDTLYVDAALTGTPTAVADPSDLPVAVPTSELPGKSNPAVWPYFILWLIGLIAAAVVAVYAAARWGRARAWLLGVPTILALMYAASDAAIRLLPNIL